MTLNQRIETFTEPARCSPRAELRRRSARAKREPIKGFQPPVSPNGVESKRGPSFKRRSRREEVPPENSAEDTWSTFLSDLAAAEQAFFSPSHAQKTAVLDYEDKESKADAGATDTDAVNTSIASGGKSED